MPIELVPLTLDNYKDLIGGDGARIVSESEILHHDHVGTSDTLLHRVGAIASDGQFVGYGMTVTGPFDPTPKEGHFEVRVRVAPEWRHKGIGSAIFAEMERFAVEHGAVVLNASVGDGDPQSLSWARHRGFQAFNHMFGSRLDLETFNAFGFPMPLGNRLRFVSLADYPATDDWFARFVDFYYELADDVPGMQGIRPSVLNLEKEKEKFMVEPEWDPHAVVFAVVDDQWAAMAFLYQRPDGTSYYNQMTGVRRDFRGMGLGVAVKCAAISYARSHGAKFMYTHNATMNEPMLAVNRKLGFQPQGGTFSLEKSLNG